MSFSYHHLDKWATCNVDLIEECLEKNPKAVVLVSGASSSGKSYCASLLESLLKSASYRAVIISLDQYNIGLSGIIPNKVNKNYFNSNISNMKEIIKVVKKVIYDVPFEKKYDKEVLNILSEKLKSFFDSKEELNKFLDGLYNEWKVLNFDEPTVYDLKEAAKDIKALLKNKSINVKKYSKVISEREESNQIISGSDYDVIIVEGIYCLDEVLLNSLKGVYTIKNFIDSNPKSLFLRRVIRDAKSTSASNVFTITNYFKYIIPSYQDTIYPCKRFADVVFNNDMSFLEMRGGDLYTTKVEFKTLDKNIINKIKEASTIKSVTYQKDTYFSVENEVNQSNNLLRLRSISEDNGLTYTPSSLVHKGIPKNRKDGKIIRPINIFLKEGELNKVWSSEQDVLMDFVRAGFFIGPIQKKIKTKLTYNGQNLTIREIDNREFFVEIDEPECEKVVKSLGRLVK